MRSRVSAVVLLALGALPAFGQGILEHTENQYRFNLGGRTIAVIMSEGVEFNEAVAIPAYWRQWGARIVYVGTALELGAEETAVTEKGFVDKKTKVTAEILLDTFDPTSVDLLYFPGGGSPRSLLGQHREKTVALVAAANRRGQTLAGFCAGPAVLAAADVIRNRRVASEMSAEAVRAAGGIPVAARVIEDGNLVTGSFPFAESFAVAVARKLTGRRDEDPSANRWAAEADFAIGVAGRLDVREVPDSLLREVVQAAMLTPIDFPMNLYKPWEVVAVKNAALRQRLRTAVSARVDALYESAGMPAQARARWVAARLDAPVYLVVVMPRKPLDARLGAIDPGPDVALRQQTLAAGAFVNDLRIVADKAGLGTHVCGGLPFLLAETEIAAVAGVPADRFVAAVVALGYPSLKSLPQPIRPAGEHLTIR